MIRVYIYLVFDVLLVDNTVIISIKIIWIESFKSILCLGKLTHKSFRKY